MMQSDESSVQCFSDLRPDCIRLRELPPSPSGGLEIRVVRFLQGGCDERQGSLVSAGFCAVRFIRLEDNRLWRKSFGPLVFAGCL